jgi:hypothetical protein
MPLQDHGRSANAGDISKPSFLDSATYKMYCTVKNHKTGLFYDLNTSRQKIAVEQLVGVRIS